MTIASTYWPNIASRDLHLVPRLVSPRFDQLLRIHDDTRVNADGDDIFRGDSPPTGVTVRFSVSFEGSAADYSLHVDDKTGEVSVGDLLPGRTRPRSFILTATVSDGPVSLSERVRVHLHNEIRARWLTPSSLMVRKGAKNMRFSVLALFDDGVVGDITNWSPFYSPKPDDRTYVHRYDEPTPFHRWTPREVDFSQLYVDIDTGVIRCRTETDSTTVAVQIDLGNELARGKVHGAPAWKTPVSLAHLAGGGFPKISDVGTRNVLFLLDGFTDTPADKTAFTMYAQGIVKLLNTHPSTSPFKLLSDTFNYFMAWVPLPQAGVSVLNELVPDHRPGHSGEVGNLPLPEPVPSDTPAKLTLEQLIDVAGLPSPVLDPATAAPDPAAVLAAVFGRDLPVLLRFRPTRAELVGPALVAEPDLGATPDTTVEGWLAQLARVRPALDAWQDVALYTTALGHGMSRPRIAQLPVGGPAQRWAGLGFANEADRPRSGLVGLALLGAPAPAVDRPWSGLLLDSWPELLPSREEDAGVVFQFDAPGAQAPQAVLLAVPSGVEPAWSYDHLERILLDTLELAKVRALDLSNLGAFAQLIPMTFLAANRANATVSTSFDGLLVADATVASTGGSG